MAVSSGYLDYVLEQLRRHRPVTPRRMFGGIGIYAEGLFFAILDDDRLYFKVDEATRAAFEERGMGPFRPFGEGGPAMRYCEVPGDVLDDVDELGAWVEQAVAVAARARRKRGARAKRR